MPLMEYSYVSAVTVPAACVIAKVILHCQSLGLADSEAVSKRVVELKPP